MAPRRGRAAACSSVGQAGAVKDVVAEDQRDRRLADELAADQKGLRQALGARLLGIAERDAPLLPRRRAAPRTAAGPPA